MVSSIRWVVRWALCVAGVGLLSARTDPGATAFLVVPTTSPPTASQRLVVVNLAAAGGYAAARAAAKAKREGTSPPQPAVVAPPPPPPSAVAPPPQTTSAAAAPSPPTVVVKEQPPVHADAAVGVPGEPAPQEAVTRLLAVLGERIGSAGRPLTSTELDALVADLDAVITSLGTGASAAPGVVSAPDHPDAAADGAADRVAQAAASDDIAELRFEGADDEPPEMEDDEDIDAIEDDLERKQAMHGMPVGVRNTYAIEGMAEMTPEEYMAALNKRTVDFQRARRREAPKVPTREYFDSLGRT